jgi:hypothetical protein
MLLMLFGCTDYFILNNFKYIWLVFSINLLITTFISYPTDFTTVILIKLILNQIRLNFFLKTLAQVLIKDLDHTLLF